MTEKVEVMEMRVKKETNPSKLGGAIAYSLLKQPIMVKAVGKEATFNAIKAVTIARGIIQSGGADINMKPMFFQVSERDGISYSGNAFLVTKVSQEG